MTDQKDPTQPAPPMDRKQVFVDGQTNCPLCHTLLDIHVRVYNEMFLREEALCPSCGVMTRVQDHKVH